MNFSKYTFRGFFFSTWVLFHEHSRFTGQQRKREAISLSPLYSFDPLHRHLDNSQTITAESSPLHIANSRIRTGKPLVSECKSLTTKLCLLFGSTYFKEHILMAASAIYFFVIFFVLRLFLLILLLISFHQKWKEVCSKSYFKRLFTPQPEKH